MTLKTLIFPLALLTACASAPVIQASGCADLSPCSAKDNVAVIAAPDVAASILASAQQGRAAFARYFDQAAAPIAIVPGGQITQELQEDLKAAGYSASLPWISAADKAKLRQSSIREQVREQTKNMPAAQQEMIMEMAMKQAGSGPAAQGEMSDTEQGALTHELGHMWFIKAFQPVGQEARGGHGYGGWAPDWLDETAAILLENETLADKRRERFKEMKAEDLYPLDTFLTMEHPALKSALALNKKMALKRTASGGKVTSGSRAMVLSGKEAEDFLKASGRSDPANFYTQARGFADYVMAATGDEQIFAKLAQYLSGGGTLESWLTKTDGLPDTMDGLNDAWDDVVASR